MLKIAVVEDQQEVRDELCRSIRKYAAENSLQVQAVPIEDGAAIAAHYEPGWDIIFMDVEMPGLDGFGAAEKIRAVDGDAVLVFVTNMAQYAIKGYEVDALDYVLKPVNYYYQFCTKLSRAVQRVERRRGRQVVLLSLLVLYVSFFVLLGMMIYACVEIDRKGALYCAMWSLLTSQTAYEGWWLAEVFFERRGTPSTSMGFRSGWPSSPQVRSFILSSVTPSPGRCLIKESTTSARTSSPDSRYPPNNHPADWSHRGL